MTLGRSQYTPIAPHPHDGYICHQQTPCWLNYHHSITRIIFPNTTIWIQECFRGVQPMDVSDNLCVHQYLTTTTLYCLNYFSEVLPQCPAAAITCTMTVGNALGLTTTAGAFGGYNYQGVITRSNEYFDRLTSGEFGDICMWVQSAGSLGPILMKILYQVEVLVSAPEVVSTNVTFPVFNSGAGDTEPK